MSAARGWKPGKIVTRPSDLQAIEHLQPVSQESGHQEALADRFLARSPQPLAEARVAEDLERPVGALLDARDQESRLAVGHLERDPADIAADERPRLPDRLGNGETKPFTGGLLDHHVRMRLE